MIFSIKSGLKYEYSVKNNRISLWKGTLPQANPIVFYELDDSFVPQRKINRFIIEMTQQCNMRCLYCCYSGNYKERRSHSNKGVKHITAQSIVHFIFENSNIEKDHITVCFYGGESLLALNSIKIIVDELIKLLREKVHFSISTNGLLLSEENIKWICSINQCSVNVSIDGNKEIHDKCRVTSGNKGTFDIISSNLMRFKEKFPDEFEKRVRFLSTVSSLDKVKQLSDFWSQNKWLVNPSVHLSLLIPNFLNQNPELDSYETKDKFYSMALEEWKKGNQNLMVDTLKKFVSIVDNRVIQDLSNTLSIKTCLNEMFSCFISAEGNLYACEKLCTPLKIGNIQEGFNINKIRNLQSEFIKRKQMFCSSCWSKRLCRMCLTGLNYDDKEMEILCEMERDSIKLALKYYCEMKEFDFQNKNKNH